MSDLISRQVAIEAICKACGMEEDYHKCDGYPEESTWCDKLVALRAVPSAEPEQRKGRWNDCGEFCGMSKYECSECGRVEFWMAKYCPHCGAKMETEVES